MRNKKESDYDKFESKRKKSKKKTYTKNPKITLGLIRQKLLCQIL